MTLERWLNLFALDLLFFLFVVLVIFMVMTPILPGEPPVYVPESTSAKPSPDHEGDLTIHLPIPGMVLIDNLALPPSHVEERLVSAHRDGARVRIRAGRRVPFGEVRRIVRAAQNAGYTRVTILLRAPKSQPSSYEFAMGWTCPPRYWQIAYALVIAAFAIGGAVAIAMRSRKPPRRPGCAGWLLFVIAAFALLIAWDGTRPSCLWY